MLDTISRYLANMSASKDKEAVRSVVNPLADRYSSCAISTAGLVIKTGGSALAKTGAADSYYVANGVLQKIAAATDMPALVGSITAAKFNVFCFFVDSGGTTSVAMGVEGAAIANIVFPQFPQGKALIGMLIVTYASTFVGGTTPLDTATTVYLSPVTSFDPTVLVG